MPTKIQVLKDINLGERVAEEEADELQKYFVKTVHWEQLAAGGVDIVYGAKGSGKSALYTSLVQQAPAFEKKRIIIVSAENPRGATIFKSILTDPPPSESEFTGLWKLYILVLAAKTIRERLSDHTHAKPLLHALETAKLLPISNDLGSYFRAATAYMKGWFERDKASVEHELSYDPTNATPTVKRKVKYAKKQDKHPDLPLDELLAAADKILVERGMTLWIAFDRLDVAFVESPKLERNALRALFRAYNDLKARSQIKLKIFVRDDVWRRIIEGGFTEASHITKSIHIEWSPETLLNLLVLRLIANDKLRNFYKAKTTEVRGSYDKQVELFYRIFPDKVATGRNPETLDWIVSRASDGTKVGKPREVIHLVDVARQNQIRELERGGKEPPAEQLIDRAAIAGALPLVSKVFYEQTLLAEHPDLKRFLDELQGQKATQTLPSLSKIWNLKMDKTVEIAKRLVDIGFFEKRGSESYWVPFLLRPALNLVQGTSDS